MISTKDEKTIAILGAGITGLQSALTLLNSGYSVHIIAEIWPEDPLLASVSTPSISEEGVRRVRAGYASAWAGAQWRTHEARSDAKAAKWDIETYKAWMKLVDEDVARECGITKVEARNYWDSPTAQFPPWWFTHVQNFSIIPTSSLPKGVSYGASYTSFAINPPVYLSWLVTQIKSQGALMTKSSISTESGLSGAIDQIENIVCGDIVAIINATGLGSLKLLGDETMYPIRGQTVLVKGVLGTGGLVTRLGKNKGKTIAIMPRQQENVTVVGVTREEGSWDVTEDTRTTAKLVEKAGEVVDVAGVKVLHAQIGLRPARRGGARVEVERVGKEEKFVIHAYGHAGAGYQNSVGCANEVLKLVQGL